MSTHVHTWEKCVCGAFRDRSSDPEPAPVTFCHDPACPQQRFGVHASHDPEPAPRRVNSTDPVSAHELREWAIEAGIDDLVPDGPRDYDEAVELVHRAFCDPKHELVGDWDREMADALRRNGYVLLHRSRIHSGATVGDIERAGATGEPPHE